MSILDKFKKPEGYDRVEEAWKSQDLSKMKKALKWKSDKPLNRHFLLLFIVQKAFEDRNGSNKMRKLCEDTARIHIAEMDQYIPILKEQFGQLPNIQTHHYLATLLGEMKRYDEAIQICLNALSMEIPPGRGGAYKVRIKQFESAKLEMIN